MRTGTSIRVGTRASPLALAQTQSLIDAMGLTQGEYEIVPMISTGDKTKGLLRDQGGKALFAKELHQRLLENSIDMAVHSMKDLETPLPTGLEIGAVSRREDPRDVIITKLGVEPFKPREKITIGTASLRRERFFKFRFKEKCEILLCRGNVETRLTKLKNGEFDALALAAAGIKRLGISRNGVLQNLANFTHRVFDTETFVPAPGQGALAIVKRTDDHTFDRLLAKVNHPVSAEEVAIERYFLKKINATCHDAIGVLARVVRQEFTLSVMFFDSSDFPLRLKEKGELAHQRRLVDRLADSFKSACEFRKSG